MSIPQNTKQLVKEKVVISFLLSLTIIVGASIILGVSLAGFAILFAQKGPIMEDSSRVKLAVNQGGGEKKLVDDFENGLRGWAGSTPLNKEIVLDSNIVYSGSKSLKWKLQIKDASGVVYGGWLWKSFNLPYEDWSQYKALEFYLYTDWPFKSLSYAIEVEHNLQLNNTTTPPNPDLLSLDLYPAQTTEKPGWMRVVIPLDKLSVRGSDLGEVKRLLFWFRKDWPFYKEIPSTITYYFDNISLLKNENIGERARKSNDNSQPPLSPPSINLIYPVYPLEFIYANSNLSSRAPVTEFSLRAAKGEIKPLTFAVFAKAKIEEMDIQFSNFISGNNVLQGETADVDVADVSVVKVWEQSAVNWLVSSNANPTLDFLNDQKIFIPELLLKDDRKSFDDGADPAGSYIRPVVLRHPFGTDISTGTLKQIWINFSILPDQPSGVYRGQIIFLKDGNTIPFFTIPLKIEVLPFELPPPELTYGIYYPWKLSGPATSLIPDNLYKEDLKEMKKSGIESIYISYGPDNDDKNIRQMLEGIKFRGLKGPLIIDINPWPSTDMEETKRRLGEIREILESDVYFENIDRYIYGVDEPHNEEKYILHKGTVSPLIHDYGEKVMTSIFPSVCLRLKQEGEALDWANLSIVSRACNPQYIEELQKETIERCSSFMTHYWQFYEENPTRNRLLAGFYLWQSGLDGAFPFGYQNWSPKSYSPYNKNPVTLNGSIDLRGNNNNEMVKFFTAVYPSSEGPVSTLEWEGFRMGITDVRYLTYLEDLTQELRENGKTCVAEQAENEIEALLKPFSVLPSSMSVYNDPYILPEKFEETKEKLVDLILRLQTTVSSITPSSGSGLAGQAMTFATTYVNPNGCWQDIKLVSFIISNPFSQSNSFYGYYNREYNQIFLRNDNNTAWLGGSGFTPGSAKIIENSYAKIDCSKTEVAGSGNILTIKWNITFKPAFVGDKKAYLYLKDKFNVSDGWQQKGTWTIQ